MIDYNENINKNMVRFFNKFNRRFIKYNIDREMSLEDGYLPEGIALLYNDIIIVSEYIKKEWEQRKLKRILIKVSQKEKRSRL